MAMRTSDRAHMHDDLRQLAKMASSPSGVTPAAESSAHAFESADSSGYVDLSAFSSTDEGWVDRELTRAKGGAVLGPGSMRPISMDALLAVDVEEEKPSRTRTWVYTGLGLLGAGVVAFLAVTMSKHAPPKAVAEATVIVAPPTVAAAPAAPASTTAAATTATVAATPSAPVASVVIAAPELAPSGKKHAGPRHPTPAAGPAHVAMARPAAAPRPVVIPAAKGGGGGDSLMDAIKASVTKK
jgi:hypothetical protein